MYVGVFLWMATILRLVTILMTTLYYSAALWSRLGEKVCPNVNTLIEFDHASAAIHGSLPRRFNVYD